MIEDLIKDLMKYYTSGTVIVNEHIFKGRRGECLGSRGTRIFRHSLREKTGQYIVYCKGGLLLLWAENRERVNRRVSNSGFVHSANY